MSLLLRFIIIPLTGTLSLTGVPPDLYPIGLQLRGYAPIVSQQTPPVILIPDTAALSFTGASSTLAYGLNTTVGTMTLTGHGVVLGSTMLTSTGDLLLTGKAPTVTISGGGPATQLRQRAIRGQDAMGLDDWWISYQA